MRTAAVLPLKSFAQAKQRLRPSLAEELRRRLALAMVRDVLEALSQTRSIELVILVTREPAVVPVAREHGAMVLEDASETGQSAAAALGVRHALAKGFERVLCVPGDCPALAFEELDTLLEEHRDERPRTEDGQRPRIVIVPDRHGSGTNGLLLCPPDAIVPSFGPNSRERHESLAREAGAQWTVAHPASLLLDIDTGDDLAVLRERLDAAQTRAAQTRAVLGQRAEQLLQR